MRTLLRCLSNLGPLWRVWLPLAVLASIMPVAVLAVPLVEMRLLDDVVLPGRVEALPVTIAIYAVLWLAVVIGQGLTSMLRDYLNERTTQHLQRRLFDHCETLSLAFSRREHSARTMSLFVNDVPMVASLLSSTVMLVLASIVTLVGGVALMLSLNWQLAIATGVAPLVLSTVAWIVTRPLRPAAQRAQEKAAELNERIQESLLGIREIVAFGQQHLQQARFSSTLRELVRLRMRVTAIDTALHTGHSCFMLVVTLVILGFGGFLVIRGETTIGTLVAMRTLFEFVFQPITMLIGSIGGIQQALGAADRIYNVLDREPEVRDLGKIRVPCRGEASVTFDRVSFGYLPGQPVLHEISLTAQLGQVVALVGPSGAGKSTLVGAIARLYDPDNGRVLLNGIDLRDVPLADLRAQIGMVFQDTFLFATTIRENIAFGREHASDEEIVAAARAANAWEIIEGLPNGLDTHVGERGARLSEGQKQRLAIARALLRQPRILILDEPMSALDARSEHLLQIALENLMRGRTTFVIAHRLATVRRADQILVLDHGRIVERGTHEALLHRGCLYRELFDLQFGNTTPKPAVDNVPAPLALATAGAEHGR